jgi:EAL domain-containing protein (putative c-di-GMP-specific phosphodiesterase class I)
MAQPDELIRNADAAMYRAKEGGRAGWLVFDDEMHRRAVERLETEVQLRRSVASGSFMLDYQPIIRRDGLRSAGYEALVRWKHPLRGIVGPDNFIPLAEETGLIEEIGSWVLRDACAESVRWKTKNGCEPPFVSVNVSGRQLSGTQLLTVVAEVLADTGLPPDRLWLEITESALFHDVDSTRLALHALRSCGVKLAVDDFGTGYTSLGNLKRFPVDVIKIDRSFVSELGRSAQDAAIVTAVVTLAHDLGLVVTAEGIETAEQLRILCDLGCDFLQGFHLGRPGPVPA